MTTATAVLYKTAPNYEKQAAREIERLGVNAIVPWDDTGTRIKVTAPGYVFAGRPVETAFLKHVKPFRLNDPRVVLVPLAAVANLYVRSKPKRRVDEPCPFEPGQHVRNGEVPAVVREVRGRTCIIDFMMLGKPHTQAIPYAQLRPG